MSSKILLAALGLSFIFITGFKEASSIHTVKEQLEKELIPLVPEGAGGMVALFKPGEETQFITLGKTSVNNGMLVNKDTLSLVASTSKMFVGLLSMRLVELGIISLESELSKTMDKEYFGIFEDVALAQHITLRQMLSHTSGLQYDTDCERNERAGQALNTILSNMALEAENNPSQKIRFTNDPTDRIFSYSNQIWIATVFIEKSYNNYLISKDGLNHELSYADILDREILSPLEMTRTGFQKSEYDPFTQDQNKLLAYVEQKEDKPAYSYELRTFDPTHRAVGGLWTTPTDLMKLAASLSSNGLITKTGKILISKPNIKQLIQPQGINGSVGLGVYNEHGRVGKGGSLSSFGSNFEIDFATGNAVASLINFRPAVPVQFDARALLALEDMGSIPRPKKVLNDTIKEKLRLIRSNFEQLGMEHYDDIFVSKFGFIGIKVVENGLIMNWNGYTVACGIIDTNRYLIFDDEHREGTEVMLAVGPNSHKPYLIFDNGNDNSQAFKKTTKSEAIPEGIPEAFKVIAVIHGTKGKIYKGTRPDGVGSVAIKINEQQGQVIAQSEGKEVPVLITKIIKNTAGELIEIWFMGNHFMVPDKLTKLIKKEDNWVMAIAISDNPEKNVEYLVAD